MKKFLLYTTLIYLAPSLYAHSDTSKPHPSEPKKQPSRGQWTKEQAVKILKIAEDIRSPDKAVISSDLKTMSDKKESLYDMRILRSTEQRAYLEFLGPPEEVGRRMLAKGRRYWSTFPDSKRVVAISKKEMIGNSVFALADMFQIDADADYDPTIDDIESVDGKEALRLELKAKHDDAPYAHITYWVEKDTSFPLKAKFYGVSGKHLKTLTVESRATLAGRLRPDITKMTDETVKGHISWWKTKTMVREEIPEHVFSKDFLSSKI
jgi:outer membrane lipoprotein-sorting protein